MLVLMTINFSFAQVEDNTLTIINPDWGFWAGWGEPGNIEEATFLVEPKGVYSEVQMFLTFGHPWGNVGNDSLEIIMNFSLPEGTIVHDSWLWIYDLPVQADILDVWTATAIYEAIVDRRTDPSLLFEEENGYHLRIYPLTANEKRKVKITLLIPTQWTKNGVLTELPTDILNLSHDEIPDYRLLLKADSTWTNEQLINHSNASFAAINDPEFGDVLEVILPGEAGARNEIVALDAPLTEGVYINTYEGADENFYQMVLNPTDFGIEVPKKKVVFCFDHLADNSPSTGVYQPDYFYNRIKSFAELELSPDDSINIVYQNGDETHLMYENWQPFSTVAFGIQPLLFNDSDVESELLTAIDFIQSTGDEGEILLISNSNLLKLPEDANPVLDTVLNAMNIDIPIHVFEYQLYFNGAWLNNIQYLGNRYFYNILTQQTSGNLFTHENSNVDGVGNTYSINYVDAGIQFLMQSLKKVAGNYDLYTSLSSGICHSRFEVENAVGVASLHHPVMQLGKYVGEMPFEIEFTTVSGNVFNVQELIIETPDLIVGDTLNEEMWAHHRIQEMEAGNPDNSTIAEIIDYSTDVRVLSKYTAFLAVEPTIFTNEGCFNCWGEEPIVFSTDEKNNSDDLFEINAVPNPFDEQVLINLTISQKTDIKNMQFLIYDQLGRLVAEPTILQRLSDEKLQLTWDGQDSSGSALPSGMYYLMVHSAEGSGSFQLVKI